jgi:hypothetical protein
LDFLVHGVSIFELVASARRFFSPTKWPRPTSLISLDHLLSSARASSDWVFQGQVPRQRFGFMSSPNKSCCGWFPASRFNQDLPFGHRTSFVTDLPR